MTFNLAHSIHLIRRLTSERETAVLVLVRIGEKSAHAASVFGLAEAVGLVDFGLSFVGAQEFVPAVSEFVVLLLMGFARVSVVFALQVSQINLHFCPFGQLLLSHLHQLLALLHLLNRLLEFSLSLWILALQDNGSLLAVLALDRLPVNGRYRLLHILVEGLKESVDGRRLVFLSYFGHDSWRHDARTALARILAQVIREHECLA